jgi:UDP-glucose 4-epimerase
VTTVLVTGAGGYIGQRLVARLVDEGVGVRALVRRPVPWPEGVDEVVGDLVDDAGVAAKAVAGADLVVHLAGANEAAMGSDPDRAIASTIAAAEQVIAASPQRVIYLSTIHVYGDALHDGAVVDESTHAVPLHPYAAARLACEEVFERSGVPTLRFRLTNGVGAPRRPDVRRWSLVANELCREGALSGRMTLRTSGAQWRDFIALRDVESIVVALIDRSFESGLFNLGSGHSVTVRSLTGLIADSFESVGEPRPELVAPPLPDEVPGAYRVDVSHLAELGLAVTTPLGDAVDETVRFCLTHREDLRREWNS